MSSFPETKSVASYLAGTASISKLVYFLRNTKIDEHEKRGIYDELQVNTIDMSSLTLPGDFKYILEKAMDKGSGDRVTKK